VVDEAGLDYVIVFEDLNARGADPLEATRPLTNDQVARGLRRLARLHSRYWGAWRTTPGPDGHQLEVSYGQNDKLA
jgi:hypothetical protein